MILMLVITDMQPVDLPELPTEQELEGRDDMIKILSSVNSVFQNSEFYIASDKDGDVENARMALMSSMEMDAGYFPKELWLSMSKRWVVGCSER